MNIMFIKLGQRRDIPKGYIFNIATFQKVQFSTLRCSRELLKYELNIVTLGPNVNVNVNVVTLQRIEISYFLNIVTL